MSWSFEKQNLRIEGAVSDGLKRIAYSLVHIYISYVPGMYYIKGVNGMFVNGIPLKHFTVCLLDATLVWHINSHIFYPVLKYNIRLKVSGGGGVDGNRGRRLRLLSVAVLDVVSRELRYSHTPGFSFERTSLLGVGLCDTRHVTPLPLRADPIRSAPSSLTLYDNLYLTKLSPDSDTVLKQFFIHNDRALLSINFA